VIFSLSLHACVASSIDTMIPIWDSINYKVKVHLAKGRGVE